MCAEVSGGRPYVIDTTCSVWKKRVEGRIKRREGGEESLHIWAMSYKTREVGRE